MAAKLPRDDSPSPDELDAEHKALKEQTAALRREHERLHTEGGTREEHETHIRNLRRKIKELEQHIEKLKALRKGGAG